MPRELRARLSSLYGMLLSGGYALGVWLQGALADRVGVRFITVSAAVFFLALVVTPAPAAPAQLRRNGGVRPGGGWPARRPGKATRRLVC